MAPVLENHQKKQRDPSLSENSLYGSDRWCAITLGKTQNWFKNNRERLETDGFPKRDGLINLTLKADVTAWINMRRRISDRATMMEGTNTFTLPGEKLNEF